MSLLSVMREVVGERHAQDAKWGVQDHPDGTGSKYLQECAEDAKRETGWRAESGDLTYAVILAEEVAEAFAESVTDKLRAELVQVAAVAVAWIESLDRRGGV